jgi:hypothetical protein
MVIAPINRKADERPSASIDSEESNNWFTGADA